MRKNKIDLKNYLEEVRAAKSHISAPVQNTDRFSSTDNHKHKKETRNESYSPYKKLNFHHTPTQSQINSSRLSYQPYSQFSPISQSFNQMNEQQNFTSNMYGDRMKRMMIDQSQPMPYTSYRSV